MIERDNGKSASMTTERGEGVGDGEPYALGSRNKSLLGMAVFRCFYRSISILLICWSYPKSCCDTHDALP